MQLEQKKTDFKSESDEISNQCTTACSKAIKNIETHIGKINSCLDGKNVGNALKELGTKFHRTVYDHFFRFEYNELGNFLSVLFLIIIRINYLKLLIEKGAMALIRDINEYRLCAKNFNSPIVDKLFSVLYSLSNLLVVKPGNLQEICAGESLVSKYFIP